MSDPADNPTLLAGEYVLGLLDTAGMRALEARAAEEPALAAEIAFWEDRLAPLGQMIEPVTPPPVLWSRLALATGIGGDGRRKSPRLWQGTTVAALAIAAGFAFLAFLPRPETVDAPGPQFIAALAPLATPVPFIAQARADGSIAVTRVANVTPGPGRSYELWALAKGASRPVSLGVLQPGGQTIHPPDRPLLDTQLLVSDEPSGGSPTGLPTGAVLFGGALTAVSPAPAPGR